MSTDFEIIEFIDDKEPAIDAGFLNRFQKKVKDNSDQIVNINDTLSNLPETTQGDEILTGSVVGYKGKVIPEGYEEVPNPNLDIYSSNPVKIGIWIKEDGSKSNIYRKYINIGVLPNATSKTVGLGVNINSIIITRFDVFPYNPTANWGQAIPNGNKDNPITIEFSESNVIIGTNTNRSAYTQTYAIFEYVDIGGTI